MVIKTTNRGIELNLRKDLPFGHLTQEIFAIFNYRFHRYIHIVYLNEKYTEELFNFIKEIKKLPIVLIFETPLVNDMEIIKNLYAAGVDIAVFITKREKQSLSKDEIEKIFPEGTVFFKDEDELLFNSAILLKKMPFLIEDRLFEPIKRKIWIDISNLKRKLRVKEIYDSYNSAGL